MLPTRAANRDGQITSIVLLKFGQPAFDELLNVVNKWLGVGLRLQKFLHRRVQSRQWALCHIVIWIGQAPCIKHEIRINGQAVFETK